MAPTFFKLPEKEARTPIETDLDDWKKVDGDRTMKTYIEYATDKALCGTSSISWRDVLSLLRMGESLTPCRQERPFASNRILRALGRLKNRFVSTFSSSLSALTVAKVMHY
jgi:hypothetical protein